MKRNLVNFILACVAFWGSLSMAQIAMEDGLPVDVKADRLEFDTDQRVLVGVGHVVIHRGGDELRADYISVDTETQDVYARGNVSFKREGMNWSGEELAYNFKTKTGDFGTFDAFLDPFYIRAEDTIRKGDGIYEMKNSTVTTCEGDKPEFRIKASKMVYEENRIIAGKHVTLWLGPVPVFYMPYWRYNLYNDAFDVDIMPGYSSKMGFFLLGAYNYDVLPQVRGTTHLDYRSKRGVGVGQDFMWRDRENKNWEGGIMGYYLNDNNPIDGKDEELERTGLVDSERYRLKLHHYQAFSDRTYLLSELNYLSDPYMIEDFFDHEYRSNVQPENQASITHIGDDYTASILFNTRLNDFYENVNRLPEISVDVPALEIPQTWLYYEGRHTATALERVFEEGSTAKDYDTMRLDSWNQVSYPMRYFGWLNVIPRAGYRGTYYSKTRKTTTSTVTNYVTEVVSSGGVDTEIVLAEEAEETTEQEMGADLRNLYEVGVETSFKAFNVYGEKSRNSLHGYRHIAEPYANYTYIPEPNLTPEQIYQFDSIDELDESHYVRLGMRNKLQTKKKDQIRDLANVNLWVDYRIKPQEDEEDIGPINWDADVYPADWCTLSTKGSYDTYESVVPEMDTRLTLNPSDDASLFLEHYYQNDERNLYAASISLYPNRKWSARGYWRYEGQTGELEEQSYFISRKSSCVGYGLGYKDRNDDWQVWLRIWVLAFPGSTVQLGL